MTQFEKTVMLRENVMPVALKAQEGVSEPEQLLEEKLACVSFHNDHSAVFQRAGAYVVLDFGKELCGGIRLITGGAANKTALFRLTLGESLTEACSQIGEKNATNDHSPRDFEIPVSGMGDVTYGMSGFRFAKLTLLSQEPVTVRNVFAVSSLPQLEKEGTLHTDDEKLNQIIDTAAYTLKLNLQNGCIWDGIKRDRLVWSGDLNPEILVAAHLYGDIANIRNSLVFLKGETPADAWINGIPAYSAWWVINLCDHYRLTGNSSFFAENLDYARAVIRHFAGCVNEAGEMDFSDAWHFMPYFLDWPTANTPDAPIGTAALLIYMAKKFLEIQEEASCHLLVERLSRYLEMDCRFKQTRAFQILAGRSPKGEAAFLEKNGAEGFSTFMAYYILKAYTMAGGEDPIALIKEYYGAMLDRGATSFWEDFDLNWLKDSGRIDQLPEPGQTDIHGDNGAFCYVGFRHSLCHGWASGVVAFMIEDILGKTNGKPCLYSLKKLEAKLPTAEGWLHACITPEQTCYEME